ncbi:MAG: hypothetical protein FWH27_05140 [Planctomycetaceae bacterium]|nr:hypothetical protein [Planctomycetaceae bacterium]
MTRFSDYFYASIPSVCLAIPFAQFLPDLSFLQGIEKLGIVGILAAGILFFVSERRSFIAKSAERLVEVDRRLSTLENQVATGNDRVVHILGEQLATLNEIKNGQSENFTRMWQLALGSINRRTSDYDDQNELQVDEEKLLRPEKDQTPG